MMINYEEIPRYIEETESFTVYEVFKYTKAVKCSGYIYYICLEESDENANTIMCDYSGKVISNNYFAYEDLFNVLDQIYKGEVIPDYIADVLKNNLKDVLL